MRIWSLHPKYLDAKGLVALWRETLLAKHVLAGGTRGYKFHPQLKRFKSVRDPLNEINYYLSVVYAEASKRSYKFDASKIDWTFRKSKITVTKGQLDYERRHLLGKLKERNVQKFREYKSVKTFDSHPLFKVVDGEVEDWEAQ